MTVVDEIKNRIDLVDYVSASVKLKHSGKNYTGFCPFHSNTRTPAFVIFPETQTWRCFGQCNEGGDIFGFVMKKEGWDFSEALRFLAERAGVQLPTYSKENGVSKDYSEQLHKILEVAALFYRQQMLETPKGHETLEYLHKRGFSDQTIKIFGMGYAPDGWEALIDYLRSKGYQDQLMLDAGLVSERDSGGYYDRFRNRLTIPIRDTYGKMVGFGARVLNPNDVPKYLNSPTTDVFDKGRLLYGLDAARQSIRANNQVVIVEGYLDVIGLHQAGFANAVSPMGTALTEDQFRLLKKFTRRIILALDPDAAGEKATLRGLETARQTMDQDSDIRFDARGLLHFEKRLNADIRVTTLPEGKDPDEIVIENPEQWENIIECAKPIVEHVMETLVAASDVNDVKVKSEIAQQVLPLIEDVPDRVEREAYRQKLAYMIKVDERALIAPSTSPLKARRIRQIQPEKNTQVTRFNDIKRSNRLLEKYCIGFLVNDPWNLNLINRDLQNFKLSIITSEDFLETDFLEVYKLIIDSLEQEEYAPRDYVEMNLPHEINEEIETGKEKIKTGEIKTEKEISEVIRVILRMRRNRIDEHLNELIFAQSELKDDEPDVGYTYQALMLEEIKLRRIIDDALQPPHTSGKL